MITLTPYLNFDGDCRDALTLYAKVLGGEIEAIRSHADSPMKDSTPPGQRDKILHARLKIGNQVLMASDAPKQVDMPMQQTFWARKFAMFKDRFGTPWMINCQ
jgi:PhnB protein